MKTCLDTLIFRPSIQGVTSPSYGSGAGRGSWSTDGSGTHVGDRFITVVGMGSLPILDLETPNNVITTAILTLRHGYFYIIFYLPFHDPRSNLPICSNQKDQLHLHHLGWYTVFLTYCFWQRRLLRHHFARWKLASRVGFTAYKYWMVI